MAPWGTNVVFRLGMTFYRRNLPHWFPEGRSIFTTWRLMGSLPQRGPKPLTATKQLSPGQEFLRIDHVLDRAVFGPVWLSDPLVARPVVEKLCLEESQFRHCRLHAFVVMSNHVHLLMHPLVEVRRMMKALKGVTARIANLILGRTGESFWQDESFDHWVRDPTEFTRIKAYIEENPVKAGLVVKPGDWPWSTAAAELANPFARAKYSRLLPSTGDSSLR